MTFPTTVKALAAVLAVIATTIASSSMARADDEQIAVFTKNLINPYYKAVRTGADKAALRAKANVVHFVPTKPDNIAEQVSQIEDAIVRKPAAIVFVPVDYKALGPAVEKVNAAGIPMVNYINRVPTGKIVTYVGSDDYKLGVAIAERMFKELGGKGRIIIVEGVRGSTTSQDRVRGFNDAAKTFPGITIAASQPGNYQKLAALQLMENLMQAHPVIDGVLSADDSMALGVVEAMEAAKRKAFVVGINATPEAVDAIKTGRMLASAVFDGFAQGCLATEAAVRHLRGASVPAEVILPVEIVDNSNFQPWEKTADQRDCPVWDHTVRTQ